MSLSGRWLAYLESWLTMGLTVSAPPLDFECILNEPIWFNRFLYLSSDVNCGRLLKAELERSLMSKGFMHLKDLCTSSQSTGASSPWLSREEATLKAGSRRLGEALLTLIGLILAS